MTSKTLTGKKFWNESAPYFDRTLSTKYLVYPLLKRLCGNVKEKNVLDVACANGELAIYLAKKGAKVTGVDYSRRMIQSAMLKAKAKGATNIEFFTVDARNLEFLSPQKYNIIIISVLLPHLKLKNDIEKFFKGVRKRLKDDGRVLLAEPHPCFDYLLRKEISKKNRSTSYFESGKEYQFAIKLAEGKKTLNSIAYHWSIQDYASAIHLADLVIKNIHEPIPAKGLAKKFPRWYKEKVAYPSYIIFELGK